ncbi:hypothetical protein SAMN04489724_4238 [Algoriphagus locisalis]|uniref:Uncharacterized protein n=1 Tax=Algoriphagus locisalis TaxID=305507 RepID=A0A1I7DPE7_9BACT|nr:hypothetical protein [Algoriphagus locisalis]SFU13514.1 hypothetical protein SAMN04489724_4238 [Algoriphagus locisalis]
MKVLVFICLYISFSNSFGQEVILKLKQEDSSGQKRNYFFNQIIDDRVQESIGQVYDSDRNKHHATFEGKLEEQAKLFYNSLITPSQTPDYNILIKVYNLDLKEIYQANQRGYKGEVQLSLGFFALGKGEPVHLVDFNGKANYGRPANQQANVQTSVQQLFANSWNYFDAWFSSQASTNRVLAKTVKLNILDPILPSNKDTVFYDPARPLTWDDFSDSPDPTSSFNATIFSSLSIEGNAEIVAGEIIQTILIKVYMLPDQSWVKKADTYGNNHEQKHFDLTRIAADRMIYQLNQADLEPTLFEATLNDIYLDGYREMNKLQELYDGQTRNGLDKEAQARWNMLVKDGLAGNWEELDQLLKTKN